MKRNKTYNDMRRELELENFNLQRKLDRLHDYISYLDEQLATARGICKDQGQKIAELTTRVKELEGTKNKTRKTDE